MKVFLLIVSLLSLVASQAIIEGKTVAKFDESTGYLITGKVDSKSNHTLTAIDRNLTKLNYNDIELVVTGPAGLTKNSFLSNMGKFSIFVPEPGTYKLEVRNKYAYFEPVLVRILSDQELSESPNKKQI